MMKRILIILLAAVLLLPPLAAYADEQEADTTAPAATEPETPDLTVSTLAIKSGSAKWETIDRGLAYLHVSGVTAKVSVTVVTVRNAAISVTTTLQRNMNGKWQTLESWSKTGAGMALSDEHGRFIEPGGAYRAVIRIRVGADDLKVYAYPEQQPLLVGDVDRDNRILARDARLTLRISARLEKTDVYTSLCADYNGDGYVRASDARSILRHSAGLR